jgi:hypothetical protein
MPGAEGAAAAAAEAKRRRDQEEEEEVTPLNSDPSGAVEYKILRSATGAFRNPAKFRAALEEEAPAGWELVEKLDNARIRLRRSIAWRQKDGELAQDPYRIQVGAVDRPGSSGQCCVDHGPGVRHSGLGGLRRALS